MVFHSTLRGPLYLMYKRFNCKSERRCSVRPRRGNETMSHQDTNEIVPYVFAIAKRAFSKTIVIPWKTQCKTITRTWEFPIFLSYIRNLDGRQHFACTSAPIKLKVRSIFSRKLFYSRILPIMSAYSTRV